MLHKPSSQFHSRSFSTTGRVWANDPVDASTSTSEARPSAAAAASSSLTKKPARPRPSRSGDGPGHAHAAAGHKPPSMWQAPQSLLHPTAPPVRDVDQSRKDVYFRRVARPDRYEGPPPAGWQRRAQVIGGVFSAAVAVYMVLFHDYGPREHVFSPVRRAVGFDQRNPFKLSAEEIAWARQEGLHVRTQKGEQAAKPSATEEKGKMV